MKRFVFIVLMLALAISVPFYRRRGNFWTLEGCTVVKDSRAPLVDAGALLTLRGPSGITVTTDTACDFSLNTKFFRYGAYVCVEGRGADPMQNRFCYKIESETKR
jgi:hypothetical protein